MERDRVIAYCFERVEQQGDVKDGDDRRYLRCHARVNPEGGEEICAS